MRHLVDTCAQRGGARGEGAGTAIRPPASVVEGAIIVDLDLTPAPWRKSSRSSQDSACVEIVFVDGQVAVRDSKAQDGSVLVFSAAAWEAFLDGVRRGEFDRRPELA